MEEGNTAEVFFTTVSEVGVCLPVDDGAISFDERLAKHGLGGHFFGKDSLDVTLCGLGIAEGM